MKKFREGSAADKKEDKRKGIKEGSAADKETASMVKKAKSGKGTLSFTPKKKK